MIGETTPVMTGFVTKITVAHTAPKKMYSTNHRLALGIVSLYPRPLPSIAYVGTDLALPIAFAIES